MKRQHACQPMNAREVHTTMLGGQAEVQGWLRQIPEAVQEAGPFAFIFDVEPPAYVRGLMDALGVEVIVDPERGEMTVEKIW